MRRCTLPQASLVMVFAVVLSVIITCWIWHPLYTTTDEMVDALKRGYKAFKRPFRRAYDARFKKTPPTVDAPAEVRGTEVEKES